jgi:tRNA 2-thiouridine synthesizing protein A
MGSDIIPAELDCVGLYCPIPIAQTKEEIDKLDVDQMLKVETDDPGTEEDIKQWAKRIGHEIITFERERIFFNLLHYKNAQPMHPAETKQVQPMSMVSYTNQNLKGKEN